MWIYFWIWGGGIIFETLEGGGIMMGYGLGFRGRDLLLDLEEWEVLGFEGGGIMMVDGLGFGGRGNNDGGCAGIWGYWYMRNI